MPVFFRAGGKGTVCRGKRPEGARGRVDVRFRRVGAISHEGPALGNGHTPPVPVAESHRTEPGGIPSRADNSRSPDGVTFTARSDPIRTHHLASSACRHSAAPAAPAR